MLGGNPAHEALGHSHGSSPSCCACSCCASSASSRSSAGGEGEAKIAQKSSWEREQSVFAEPAMAQMHVMSAAVYARRSACSIDMTSERRSLPSLSVSSRWNTSSSEPSCPDSATSSTSILPMTSAVNTATSSSVLNGSRSLARTAKSFPFSANLRFAKRTSASSLARTASTIARARNPSQASSSVNTFATGVSPHSRRSRRRLRKFSSKNA
mmetsp:Transcript_8563/g.17091  ORF Transcript_8563/g.17091 Transcript_8563/m.17091 type:complete len:212 (-) Transcript_8563:788-1423(-)